MKACRIKRMVVWCMLNHVENPKWKFQLIVSTMGTEKRGTRTQGECYEDD